MANPSTAKVLGKVLLLATGLLAVVYLGFYPIYGINRGGFAVQQDPQGRAVVVGIPESVEITDAPPGIDQVMPGDIVLTENNVPVRQDEFTWPGGFWQYGRDSIMVLQRGTQTYTVRIPYLYLETSYLAALSLRPFISILLWSLAALLLLTSNLSSQARLAGLAAYFYSVTIVALYTVYWSIPLSGTIASVTVPLAGAAYTSLAMVVGAPMPLGRARKALAISSWVLHGGVCLVFLADYLIVRPAANVSITGYGLFLYLLVAWDSLLTVLILGGRAIASRKQALSAPLALMAIGCLLAFLPSGIDTWHWLSTNEPLLTWDGTPFILTLPFIFVAPLAFSFATLRYRFVRLDEKARDTLVVLTGVFAAAIVYLLLIAVLRPLVPNNELHLPSAAIASVSGVMITGYFRGPLHTVSGRMVYGTRAQTLRNARVDYELLRGHNLHRLAGFLVEQVADYLSVSNAAFYTTCGENVYQLVARRGSEEAPVELKFTPPPQEHVLLQQEVASSAWPIETVAWATAIVPLGKHGILLYGSRPGAYFDQLDLEFFERIQRASVVALHSMRFQESWKAMAGRALRVFTLERQRLARVLHDKPLQRVKRIFLQLETEGSQLGEKGPLFIAQLSAQLSELIRDLRSVSKELSPSPSDTGLGAMISFLTDVARGQNPNVSISCDIQFEDEPSRAPELTEVVRQFLVEGIENALRHANPDTIEVGVRHDQDFLYVWVDDDGPGLQDWALDTELLRAEGHHGLAQREALVASIGGSIHWERSPLGGVRLRAQMPLEFEPLPNNDFFVEMLENFSEGAEMGGFTNAISSGPRRDK